MDAPLDKEGRLLPAFERIRDIFLNFANIVTLQLDGKRDKNLHTKILDAIGPDIVAGRVRASAHVYKNSMDGKCKETPPRLTNSDKNFHTGEVVKRGVSDTHIVAKARYSSDSKKKPSEKKLTVVQRRHLESGFTYYRAKTPRQRSSSLSAQFSTMSLQDGGNSDVGVKTAKEVERRKGKDNSPREK
jgi:hypothetical protein